MLLAEAVDVLYCCLFTSLSKVKDHFALVLLGHSIKVLREINSIDICEKVLFSLEFKINIKHEKKASNLNEHTEFLIPAFKKRNLLCCRSLVLV